MTKPLSIHSLANEVARLGVSNGDTVMVHAALRAIGPTEAGAEGIIEALDRAVGAIGTLLMVLGAQNEWASINTLVESERIARLEGAEPFDALLTPADPDVGTLAEVFRRRSGTLVSDHPEGRFAARGFAAEALIANPPWDDYFGPGSALERLVDSNGKVLRLGADPNTITLLHYAEYLTDIPEKRRARRHRLVSTEGGPTVRIVDCLDDEHGIVDYPGGDYFATILRDYIAEGRAQIGTVGRAVSELIDARDIIPFAVTWMNTNLGSL